MMILIFALLAVAFYCSGAFLQYRYFRGVGEARRHGVILMALIGTLFHGLSLCIQIIGAGDDLCLNLLLSSSFIALIINAIVIYSSFSKPVNNLMIGTLPISALILLVNLSIIPIETCTLEYSGSAFLMHAMVSLAAYSLISIAALQALFLSFHESHIKHQHSLSLVTALPSLEAMERLLFEFLWAGLILLSFSLLTGIIYFHNLLLQPDLLIKTVLSFLSWCFLAVLCVGRLIAGWRGVVVVRMTLAGCICLMLAYFGCKFALEVML